MMRPLPEPAPEGTKVARSRRSDLEKPATGMKPNGNLLGASGAILFPVLISARTAAVLSFLPQNLPNRFRRDCAGIISIRQHPSRSKLAQSGEPASIPFCSAPIWPRSAAHLSALSPKASAAHRANVKQIMVIFNFSPPYIVEASRVEPSGGRPVWPKQPPQGKPGRPSTQLKIAICSPSPPLTDSLIH